MITLRQSGAKPLILLSFLLFSFSSFLNPSGRFALNPVGQYEFNSSDDGQTFTADIKIEGEPGKYKGTVKRRDRDNSFSFTDVAVSGNNMIIVADVRNSVFVIRLYFSGESFSGTWSLGSEGNELKGKRLK